MVAYSRTSFVIYLDSQVYHLVSLLLIVHIHVCWRHTSSMRDCLTTLALVGYFCIPEHDGSHYKPKGIDNLSHSCCR